MKRALANALIVTLSGLMLVGLVTACGDDDDGGSGGGIKDGIYKVSKHFRNEDACAELDTSDHEALEEQYFFISGSFFGLRTAYSCASPDACRTLKAELDSDDSGFPDYAYSFSGGLTGYFSGGRAEDGTCSGTTYSEEMSAIEGGVRSEKLEYPFEGVSEDSDGFCDDSEVDAFRTADNCAVMEVYEGEFVESL